MELVRRLKKKFYSAGSIAWMPIRVLLGAAAVLFSVTPRVFDENGSVAGTDAARADVTNCGCDSCDDGGGGGGTPSGDGCSSCSCSCSCACAECTDGCGSGCDADCGGAGGGGGGDCAGGGG